jgi:predicted metal-binding membrane protein
LPGAPAPSWWPGSWAAVLLVATAGCWTWLVAASLDMYGRMDGWAAWMMQPHWDLRYAGLVALMWVAMMLAMMLPSAWPALRIHHVVASRANASGAGRRSLLFATGYLLAWAGFSVAATGLQWLLSAVRLLDPMMTAAGAVTAGLLLLAAGAWQWTHWKAACLAHCRAPLAFLVAHWRPGGRGALLMGLQHGGFCLGCCWALMLLLFAGGVMHLGWILGIALFVAFEKCAPPGPLAGRVAGVLMVVMGLVQVASAR